jgi:hypothetical protein
MLSSEIEMMEIEKAATKMAKVDCANNNVKRYNSNPVAYMACFFETCILYHKSVVSSHC